MSVKRKTAREIADDIAKRIPAEYPPGTQLKFAELRSRYGGVSPSTIQRAMSLLGDRGLAVYVHGVGWFVDDSDDEP